MTTTPPPMPDRESPEWQEFDRVFLSSRRGTVAPKAPEVAAFMGWMAAHERITALEADRKMLREALERVRYWAEGTEALYTNDHPVALARAALESTK